ncbi:major polyhedral calyx protein [Condylorrhiza vestigialis mutiple nucleopolyhedrovirus]|uniref:Major polyhedral calyx protein n=1 Tax=Condylorrhiza vestigialis mutiple nucleopolyhedrovirus TaxID=1592576 RepID=A0A0B4UK11_9ABAC|nr:major polyhedral calyx protein [Condylorrhiza vestigialis mutiple nucleopolyhedrovirus]AJD09190.1 major polyhedral calyx protein [Condylorrhiza vestigialis mutiple nucleopolyhedrovirus]
MTSSCMTPNNNVMFDDASVMWIDADYIFQNSKMPLSTFQQLLFSIPSKHRKMINDIGNPPSCSFPPSNNTVKYMVDIYGAAVLALRCPSLFSDQLLTTFIANNYMSFCNRQRPPPCQPPTPPFDCVQKQIVDALDKLAHQNDLLINSVNQISLNQSNQFLELRTQYAQILTALENAKDTILNRLNVLVDEIKAALPDQSAQLQEQIDKLLEAINVVAQTLRNEMNNTNSILTNLASSITNINSTLNNLLTAIEGITGGEGGGLSDVDRQKLNDVLDLVTEIRSILMGSRK